MSWEIDPTDPRDTSPPKRSRRPRAAANSDPVALIALSLEIAPLRDLEEWPPVGGLLETFAEAASGDGSLSRRDVDRLRVWSARWGSLRPRLRAFYRNALQSLSFRQQQRGDRGFQQQAVSRALWRIFEGFELQGWERGALLRLWETYEGTPATYDIAPRGRCGTSRPR